MVSIDDVNYIAKNAEKTENIVEYCWVEGAEEIVIDVNYKSKDSKL